MDIYTCGHWCVCGGGGYIVNVLSLNLLPGSGSLILLHIYSPQPPYLPIISRLRPRSTSYTPASPYMQQISFHHHSQIQTLGIFWPACPIFWHKRDTKLTKEVKMPNTHHKNTNNMVDQGSISPLKYIYSMALFTNENYIEEC